MGAIKIVLSPRAFVASRKWRECQCRREFLERKMYLSAPMAILRFALSQ